MILILATTEPEKLPVTVLSRTQQFYFKHIPLRVIVQKLQHIAKAEKIKITDEALELIASSAEGSFRDAESLFDQLIAAGDTNITLQMVETMVGKIGFDALAHFAELLLTKDLQSALTTLADIYDRGYNIAQFTKDNIQYLRRTAVLHYNPEMQKLFAQELMAAHVQQLIAHSALFKETHLTLLKSLIVAYGQMRYSQFPIIPLEIAIIENLK